MEKKLHMACVQFEHALKDMVQEFYNALASDRKSYTIKLGDKEYLIHPPTDKEDERAQMRIRHMIVKRYVKGAIMRYFKKHTDFMGAIVQWDYGVDPDDFVCEPSEHQMSGRVTVELEDKKAAPLNFDAYQVKNDLGFLENEDAQED